MNEAVVKAARRAGLAFTWLAAVQVLSGLMWALTKGSPLNAWILVSTGLIEVVFVAVYLVTSGWLLGVSKGQGMRFASVGLSWTLMVWLPTLMYLPLLVTMTHQTPRPGTHVTPPVFTAVFLAFVVLVEQIVWLLMLRAPRAWLVELNAVTTGLHATTSRKTTESTLTSLVMLLVLCALQGLVTVSTSLGSSGLLNLLACLSNICLVVAQVITVLRVRALVLATPTEPRAPSPLAAQPTLPPSP